jgi:hypothetical protein
MPQYSFRRRRIHVQLAAASCGPSHTIWSLRVRLSENHVLQGTEAANLVVNLYQLIPIQIHR